MGTWQHHSLWWHNHTAPCLPFIKIQKQKQSSSSSTQRLPVSTFLPRHLQQLLQLLQTKVEIVVTEENKEGMKIVAAVREIGASMLVVGLHDQSFLYSLAMVHSNIANYFNCRILAINQPPESPLSPMVGVQGSSTNMDFSQIDISGLQVPEPPPPKVKYRICPDPTAIICRLRRSRRRRWKKSQHL